MKETQTITVTILPDGKTCKEVNRFQKLNYREYYSEMAPVIGKKATIDMYHRNNFNWQEAESKLRTFTIEVCDKKCECVKESWELSSDRTGCNIIGSTHTAEIIDKDKLIVRIL